MVRQAHHEGGGEGEPPAHAKNTVSPRRRPGSILMTCHNVTGRGEASGWIPACAGMTVVVDGRRHQGSLVFASTHPTHHVIPACAGMTASSGQGVFPSPACGRGWLGQRPGRTRALPPDRLRLPPSSGASRHPRKREKGRTEVPICAGMARGEGDGLVCAGSDPAAHQDASGPHNCPQSRRHAPLSSVCGCIFGARGKCAIIAFGLEVGRSHHG